MFLYAERHYNNSSFSASSGIEASLTTCVCVLNVEMDILSLNRTYLIQFLMLLSLTAFRGAAVVLIYVLKEFILSRNISKYVGTHKPFSKGIPYEV